MDELLSSGALVDFALTVLGLEAIALALFWARTRRGLAPIDIAGQLLAGACLLFAVRCALTGADARLTLVALAASFPAHLFDLVRRARSSSR